jgi:hypothetical protein
VTVESPGDWIPGKIVVDVKDDMSEEDIQKLGDEVGLMLTDNSPDIKDDGKIELADVEPSRLSSILARLRGDPRVEAAEPLGIAKAYFTPNDPKYSAMAHDARRRGARLGVRVR